MNVATISVKNQITIPAKVIKLWSSKLSRRKIIWDVVNHGQDKLLIIKPKPQSMVNEFAGIAKDLFRGEDSETYLQKERKSWN